MLSLVFTRILIEYVVGIRNRILLPSYIKGDVHFWWVEPVSGATLKSGDPSGRVEMCQWNRQVQVNGMTYRCCCHVPKLSVRPHHAVV